MHKENHNLWNYNCVQWKSQCYSNFKDNHTWHHDSLTKLVHFIKSKIQNTSLLTIHMCIYYKWSMATFSNILQVESNCMEAPSTCTWQVGQFFAPLD